MRQFGVDLRLVRPRWRRFSVRFRTRGFDACRFLQSLGLPCEGGLSGFEDPMLPGGGVRAVGAPAPEPGAGLGPVGRVEGGGSCLQAACSGSWVGQDGLGILSLMQLGATFPSARGVLRFFWDEPVLYVFCRGSSGFIFAKNTSCPALEEGEELARAANSLGATALGERFGCFPCP